MTTQGYETFDHGADIGVRCFGPTREIAFEEAAMAMTSVMTQPEKVASRLTVNIACDAPDDELLLVDWLNALIYEMSTRKIVFGRYRVQIHNHFLTGTAEGEEIEGERHQPAVEIKGATYTALAVRETESGGWLAQCVVDV